MKAVFFDTILHFGGGAQLAADTAIRLKQIESIEVIDAFGGCGAFKQKIMGGCIPFHVLCPESQQNFIGGKGRILIRLLRILKFIPIVFSLRWRLRKMIKELSPDVLWTHSTFALFLLWISTGRPLPVCFYVCGCVEAKKVPWYQRFLLKKRADRVMAISTETAQQMQLIGVQKKRTQVVFDTIDFEATLAKSKQPLQSSLPGIDRSPRIVIGATLIPAKGQEAAIKAIALLKSKGLNPVLWLAGDCPGEDRRYLDNLQSLVTRYLLTENVFFLGWRTDVPRIIAESDMVVLPTHSEGFGHIILEAMLLKRPVIATPVGGIKDSIQNEENGLLFPVDDEEKLAEQITRLHKNKAFADRIAQKGYETVHTRFSPSQHTKRVLDAMHHAVRDFRKKRLQ